MNNAIYYVYIYYDHNKTPFYVGYGKNGRMFDHLKEARKNPTPVQGQHKLNKIRKMVLSGHDPIITVIAKDLLIHEAHLLEKSLIRSIGRRDLGLGPLTNLSDGGEGVSNPSEKNRKDRSKKQKNKIACYDNNGNYIFVDKSEFDPKKHSAINKGKFVYTNGKEFAILSPKDELVKSGIFYRVNKGKCVVVDNGIHKMVSIEEKISKNLTSMNKGKVAVIDSNGNKFLADTTDERIASGELKRIVGSKKVMKCVKTGKLKTFDQNEEIPNGYVGQNKGGAHNLVTVINDLGEKYRVLKTDERIGRTLYKV